MKALQTFRITPVAAAVFVAFALLASGCNKHTDDTTPPAATADTTTPPPAETTAPPADTAAANDNMAGDTGATAGTDTSAMGNDMNAGPAATGPVTDTDFYTDAMKGDQKEIAAAQLAAKSGSSADVKALAKKIESDHKALDKKVKAAAGSTVTPPADTGVDPSLEGKTGKDLDSAFVSLMVSDHQMDIPKFENASKNASTDAAKKLATDALPTLRDHLKAAQDLQAKMGT